MGAGFAIDIDQFQAAAAQISNHAMRAGKGAEHAVRAGHSLFLAGQQPRRQAERGNLVQEFAAIGGIAHRGRGHDIDLVHPLERQQDAIARQRGKRGGARAGAQHAVFRHALAQARGYLFVVEHGRRAQRPAIDDEAQRVRPDVDDRAGRVLAIAAVGKGHDRAQSAAERPRRSASLGTLRPLVSAAPRPDSEGFVMK